MRVDGAHDLRVAMAFPFALARESSVGHKVRRKIEIWQELGVESRVFVIDRGRSEWDDALATVTIARGRGELGRQMAAWKLASEVRRWRPSIVYTRFSLYAPGFHERVPFVPIVEEVNTDEDSELPLWGTATSLYHRATRTRVQQGRGGFVCVTNELADLVRRRTEAPVVTIANGVDLASIASIPAPRNERPRLLLVVGTASPWHGVDKFGELARLRPDLDFDLVGPVSLGDVPENVTEHGVLRRPDLERVAARADVAVGTLALHRKSMREACPLKVREYLAMGIPTVVAHDDPDLDSMSEGIMRIPNRPDNILTMADAIARFAYSCRGRRVPRIAVRDLDSHRKEEARIALLRQVVQETWSAP